VSRDQKILTGFFVVLFFITMVAMSGYPGPATVLMFAAIGVTAVLTNWKKGE